MSRPVSYTSAVTVNIASYSGATNVNTSNTGNGINGSGNTSSYAGFSGSTSNSSGYAYYNFDSISIPQNATINSVSCVARNRAYAGSNGGTSRGTCGLRLIAGNTEKGTEYTYTSTANTAYTLTTGNNWTPSDVNNGVSLRILIYRSTTNWFGCRFYGATLTVNYTVNGTIYSVSASSEYASATVSPVTQEVMEGESATIAIFPDDINNIVVKDNGTDVTDQLQYVVPTPGTQSFTGAPVSYDSIHSSVAGIASDSGVTNGFTPATSTTRVSVSSHTEANSETSLYFNFDCSSIPANATIISVSCDAKAVISSGYFPTRIIQLCAGTTKKGSPTTVTNSSINNTVNVQTIANTGTWTRSELNDIKILIQGIRTTSTNVFNISFYGATLTVQYTLPTDPYYAYTLTNVSADHDILVSESIIVPPEEDPTKTYYSLTISSINSTTDPGRGTTRVESGTGQTITITPSDPKLTLALDNGVDVSNQLVPHGTLSPSSAVTNITTTYGFTYNSSTGYYVSNNNGVSNSAAVARVTLNLPVRALVTFQYINYAEATYDFGVFSKVDTALSTAAWTSSSNAGDTTTDAGLEQIRLNTSSYNTANAQTLTYEISAGEHFIDVKYAKDQASDEYNDSLQFKITTIELLEPTVAYYTYDLSNISTDHSLVFIFGNVTYYFVTSSTDSNAKLYPDGQMVELPGETYKLTIVPENSGDTITVRDNNVDVTSSVERKEVVVEKGGQQVTVVNYIYHIVNVQTGHTVVVYSASAGDVPYMKVNGAWVQLSAIYKKENGTWVEQESNIDIFDDGTIYIKGN